MGTFGDAPLMRKALGAAFGQGSQAKEQSDLIFMYGGKTMDLFDRVKSHFGVEDEQLPAFVINNDEGKWHLFNGEIAQLPQFISDWKEGKVDKTIKSAAVPAEPYEDDVRVV